MSKAFTAAQIVSAFIMLGSSATAFGDETLRSCSSEDQKKFYRALLSADQTLRSEDAARDRGDVSAEAVALRERIIKQDAANQAQLDFIVQTCGWPTDGPFYTSNLMVAFLVVQHSPKAFTERYRPQIEDAFEKGLIPPARMADFKRYVELKKTWK